MLSAIEVIGACSIILIALYGLIAMALMLLIWIKGLFATVKEYGFPRSGTRTGFRGLMADAKARPRRFLLVLGIACLCIYFAEYVLLGLIALGLIAAVIETWRGDSVEGRLTRYLSRPPFVDEGRRATRDGSSSVG
jgi:hypothetical protein